MNNKNTASIYNILTNSTGSQCGCSCSKEINIDYLMSCIHNDN